MDVYSFINSTAVRNHLQKIDYQFSGFEAAWLVYNCQHATLAEKHAAWREIIETMPDEEAEGVFKSDDGKKFVYKLHESLEKQIESDNHLVSLATQENSKAEKGKFIYRYSMLHNNNTEYFDDYGYYSSYNVVIQSAEYNRKMKIWRLPVDDPDPDATGIMLILSENREVLYVFQLPWRFGTPLAIPALRNLQFNLPTPFESGDILYEKSLLHNRMEPFVFVRAFSDLDYEKHYEFVSYDVGYMPTYAKAYFADMNGKIEANVAHDYTSFEYYSSKPLSGKKCVLSALSDHLRDTDDLRSDDDPDGVLFAQKYAKILATSLANDIKLPESWES